jgi:hypothetical protein
LSRDWLLDHYELNRQEQGMNFLVADVYDNYLTSLQGINKELNVERFTQTSVMEMIACTDTFGPEEVDIPVSDADVERHLEFLAQRLGYRTLQGSDLWTKDLPVGLYYESNKGLHTLREQQSLTSGVPSLLDQYEQTTKKRKTDIRQTDSQSLTSDPTGMLGVNYDDLPELTTMMTKKDKANVAPTTPNIGNPTDDQEAPDIGFYLNLMIDQLGQLNENLREQRQDMQAMRALVEEIHDKGQLASMEKNDGTTDAEIVDNHGNSNSISHYLSSIENKIFTLASAISKDFISFNRKQASVIQGQHDLRLTMETWKNGLINELTEIHETLQSHENKLESDQSKHQEHTNINQIRIDNFLEVALDMMENISNYKTQSDFQSQMLRNIDDDVAYLRRVHTIEDRNIPVSRGHQLHH